MALVLEKLEWTKGALGEAIFSPCQTYRYALIRRFGLWYADGPG